MIVMSQLWETESKLPHNSALLGGQKWFPYHPSIFEKQTKQNDNNTTMDFSLESRDIKNSALDSKHHRKTMCSLGRFESGSFLLSSTNMKVASARSGEQRKTFIYKRKFNGTMSVTSFHVYAAPGITFNYLQNRIVCANTNEAIMGFYIQHIYFCHVPVTPGLPSAMTVLLEALAERRQACLLCGGGSAPRIPHAEKGSSAGFHSS